MSVGSQIVVAVAIVVVIVMLYRLSVGVSANRLKDRRIFVHENRGDIVEFLRKLGAVVVQEQKDAEFLARTSASFDTIYCEDTAGNHGSKTIIDKANPADEFASNIGRFIGLTDDIRRAGLPARKIPL
jgi:hypothetical protein